MSDDKHVRFVQCRLQQGPTQQVAWIEQRGAILGATVELIGDGFWLVIAVGGEMGADDLRHKQKMDRGALPSLKKD